MNEAQAARRRLSRLRTFGRLAGPTTAERAGGQQEKPEQERCDPTERWRVDTSMGRTVIVIGHEPHTKHARRIPIVADHQGSLHRWPWSVAGAAPSGRWIAGGRTG